MSMGPLKKPVHGSIVGSGGHTTEKEKCHPKQIFIIPILAKILQHFHFAIHSVFIV